MVDVTNILHRLRRKTVAGQPVFPTPLEMEAADAIEALMAELDRRQAASIPEGQEEG